MKRDFAVAVKAVIVKEDRALILTRSPAEMKYSYMNHHQKWDLPGGGLHFYERAEEGLLREIMEETGMEVFVGEPLSLFDVVKNNVHLCIFTYVCRWKAGEVRLSREHDDFFWMSGEEIGKSELPRWMIRDLQKGLAKWVDINQAQT